MSAKERSPRGPAAQILADARLYLILTREICRIEPTAVLEQAVQAGVRVVQVREKDLRGRDLLAWCSTVRSATRDLGALMIVNDDPGLAIEVHADGVHLGQADEPIRAVRQRTHPNFLIGISTHGTAQVLKAQEHGADYAGVGPLFDTPTKGLSGMGLGLLRDSLAVARIPCFGIGGLDERTLPSAVAAGLRRAAVSSAICSARDPGPSARRLLELIEGGGER